MLNRLEAWRAAPPDLGFVHRQFESWPPPEQGLEGAHSLDARELVAKAEMNSGSEGDMAVRLSLKIEPPRARAPTPAGPGTTMERSIGV